MKSIIVDSVNVFIDETDYESVLRVQDKLRWDRNGVRLWDSGNCISLATFLMGPAPSGFVWDHKDKNACNNTRINFRLADKSQNATNSKNRENTISKLRGVRVLRGKYIQAEVWKGTERHYLGSFSTLFKAASAYNNVALKLHGEFASLNDLTCFPEFIGPKQRSLFEDLV